MRATAKDGAVVTVDPDPPSGGWAVNCTICGYVSSGGHDEKRQVVVDAEGHHGWHDGEHDRVQQYR